MPFNQNIDRLKKLLRDFTVDSVTTHTGSIGQLTMTGINKQTNGTHGYNIGRNVVVKVVSGSGLTYLENGTHGSTTSIKVPANSVIRSVTAVVTKTVERGSSSTIGIRAGTSAGDATIVNLVADSLITADTTNIAQGVGASTNSGSAISLTSNKALVQTANNYFVADGEVFVAAIPSTGVINGEFGFIVEFDYLGDSN